MTRDEIVRRLFLLAQQLVVQEEASSYSTIAEIQGTHSWWFLEHLEDIPASSRGVLLRALVKRRFFLEGLRGHETKLSSVEQDMIKFLLEHDNSLHGQRIREAYFASLREEMFRKCVAEGGLSGSRRIREALRKSLKRAEMSITLEQDTRNTIRWSAPVSSLTLVGWLDLGESQAQASSFVVLKHRDRPLHTPVSHLQLFGIGTTTWNFLLEGEEDRCATHTISLFSKMFDLVSN